MKKNLIISVTSLSVRVFGACIQLAVSWIIVRLYGIEAVGSFFIGLMLVTGLAILAKKGVDVALVQYLPGRGLSLPLQHSIVGALSTQLLTRGFLLAVAVSGILWIFVSSKNYYQLIWMIYSLGGVGISALIAEYLKTRGQIIKAGILQFVAAPAMAMGVYGIFFLKKLDPATLGISAEVVWFGAWLFVLSMCLVYLKDAKKGGDGRAIHLREISKLGAITVQVNILGFAIGWMDIGLSALLYDKDVAGVYSVANKIAMTGTFIAVAITSVYGRKISAAYQEKNTTKLQQAYKEAHKVSIMLGAPVALILIIFSGSIMGIWGEEFKMGTGILMMMVCGQNFLIFFGPSNYAMLMLSEGAALKRIYAMGVVSMVFIALCLNMTFHNSIYSVATATFIGNLIISSTSYFVIRKKIFACS